MAPPPPPPVVDHTAELEDVRTYVEATLARIDSLAVTRAPHFEEGDFERDIAGYKDGDAWVLVTDEMATGEYSRELHMYVLRDGSLIYWSRSGFAHQPTDTQDLFEYYDEEVVLAPDGEVLRGRRRAKSEESSGMDVDLSEVEWLDMEVPRGSLDAQALITSLGG